MKKKEERSILSASIMCADILHIQEVLDELEASRIDYIHCDIMDNHYVNNLMLPMYQINRFHEATTLPFDIHIMAEDPESIIDKLNLNRDDFVYVHYECTKDIHGLSVKLRAQGVKIGVALSPFTPIENIMGILCDVDAILLMMVVPGFSGQPLLPNSIDRIRQTRKMLKEMMLEHILIEVDGSCSFERIQDMHKAVADAFVLGSSSLFDNNQSISEGVAKLRSLL